MKKVFIFDIDGTLIDSNDFHALAWQQAFAIYDKSIPLAQIRSQMGKGADQFLPRFLTAREKKKIGKELTELRDTIFRLRYLPHIQPFPGVRRLFKKIRHQGARIALASSANEEDLEHYKSIAHIEDLVERSTSSDDARSSKPQPDIFHAALRKMKNPPKETVLVIGDSPFDAIAATKAGLPVIGVLCGGFSERTLKTNGCQTVYRDPRDVLRNLEKIMGV